MAGSGEARPTVIKILLESLTDIVLLASSLPLSLLNYSESDRAYFIVTGGVLGGFIVYYVKDAAPPAGRYVHVDRVSGKYSFGDSVSLEPNHVSVLVLRIKEHGLGPF